MLVLHRFDAPEVAALLPVVQSQSGLSPEKWEEFCRERGFLAFAAEDDGELAGLAVAESHPSALRVVHLEGTADACTLLLDRLVRLAGERDVAAGCREDREDLRGLLEARGFTRAYAGEARNGSYVIYRLAKTD